jgi:kynurenine formamidase
MNHTFGKNLKLVDLSVSLGKGCSELVPVDIDYMDHQFGGRHLSKLSGVEQQELPGGLGWASEHVFANTHAGTHIDAPFHYSPQCGDRASRTIDELPLDWFWGPGVCLNVDQCPDNKTISPDEILAFEEESGVRIGGGWIVLFRTGAGRYYGSKEYSEHGRGFAPETVSLLADRGVRLFGTDAWSIDPPFRVTCEKVAEQGPKVVWEAHYVGRNREFCAIEKLNNLEHLPPHGFWVASFPIKVRRGSAAWTRAVALVEC